MGHIEARNKSNKLTNKAVHHDPGALTSLMANPREKLVVSWPLQLLIRLAFRLIDIFHIWRFPPKDRRLLRAHDAHR